MLYLTNIFLNKYHSSYIVKGLTFVYKFPKNKLYTYSEKKRPYRNLTSIGIVNYINVFDHAVTDTSAFFSHYFASNKYIYSNIKTTVLK